jgi:isoleucyl-tRNA synthetase
MVAEEVWRGLTAGRSVHLQDWPDASLFANADELALAMDQVREVSSVAQSLRKGAFLRVRLPLSKLTVVTVGADKLAAFTDLLADELNVKSARLVELSLDSANDFGVVKRLTVNSRAAGPRLGKNVQAVIQAAKAGDWSQVDGKVIAGGVELVEGEYELDLVADLTSTTDEAPTDLVGILSAGGFIILDGKVTPELAAEGLARDVTAKVENERRLFAETAKADGKPDDVIEKIVDGQISKWAAERSLLDQEHFNSERYEGKTIEELRTEVSAKTGENVRIARFARFEVGAGGE